MRGGPQAEAGGPEQADRAGDQGQGGHRGGGEEADGQAGQGERGAGEEDAGERGAGRGDWGDGAGVQEDTGNVADAAEQRQGHHQQDPQEHDVDFVYCESKMDQIYCCTFL